MQTAWNLACAAVFALVCYEALGLGFGNALVLALFAWCTVGELASRRR